MPIENIGTCGNQAEAMRAIRFLSRRAGLPIGFFGITNRTYVREVPNEPNKVEFTPIVTFDNDAFATVNGGYPLSVERLANMTGAIGAYLTMAKRVPIRKRQPMTTIHPMAAR